VKGARNSPRGREARKRRAQAIESRHRRHRLAPGPTSVSREPRGPRHGCQPRLCCAAA
jgi:hypothetical protein